MADKIYDVVIVGAGTAGLSAAIYALRAGKSVLVLEEKMYGGQIVVTPEIENYPGIAKISGFEFAQSLYQQAKNLGMEYQTGRVLKLQKKENCHRGDLEAAEFTGEHSCRPLFQVSAEKGDQQETYQAQSVLWDWRMNRRWWGMGYPIVPHVMVCFSGESLWLWQEAAIRHWKMLYFWHNIAKRSI